MNLKMKDYVWSCYSHILKRIKTYILKTNRHSKRKKAKQLLVKYDDDPDPACLANRRAKFTPYNSRGKFGSFFIKKSINKPANRLGCRSPPISFVFGSEKRNGGYWNDE